MNMNNQLKMRRFGMRLLTVAGLILLGCGGCLQAALAQETETKIAYGSVENTAPTVVAGSIHLNDGATNDPTSITLTEGGAGVLRCKFELTDPDGCGDIDELDTSVYYPMTSQVFIYYSGAWDADNGYCYPNERNCYSGLLMTCSYDAGSCTGGADLTAAYTCKSRAYYDGFDEGARYYSQPSIESGNWNCGVMARDEGGLWNATVTGSTPTEINELLAIRVAGTSGTYPSSDYFSYGNINLGEVSGAQTLAIENTGNMVIDSDIKSYADSDPETIACTTGTIPVGNQNYSLTPAFTWNSATADSSTVFHVESSNKTLDANIPVSNWENDLYANYSSVNSYWRLKMPSAGVDGTCADSLVFTVKENI